ncbi:MAG: helix-turn-helix domain-containing protein [Bacteroidetes bacterium]|nr:helix-turn-helix domain-containing protein [Bacteroidota bacterium]
MENQILNELQELKKLTVLSAKQALTMSEAAILTGLSKSHLYKKVMLKEIPYYKSDGGKITYFDKSELTAWCLKHRVKTNAEIEAEAATYVVTGKKGGA